MRRRDGSHVRSDDDTVERECAHCGWYAVAGSYPKLVERYQNHLRAEHPQAWVRG